MLDASDLKMEIENIKKNVEDHDRGLDYIFKYLDELSEKESEPRVQIGYKK